MDPKTRIEHALERALSHCEAAEAPPGLSSALHYAIFPGGHRIRPQLCVAVAMACGDDAPAVTDGAAASIELMHCASLVYTTSPPSTMRPRDGENRLSIVPTVNRSPCWQATR